MDAFHAFAGLVCGKEDDFVLPDLADFEALTKRERASVAV
jgi:hypothetical protein